MFWKVENRRHSTSFQKPPTQGPRIWEILRVLIVTGEKMFLAYPVTSRRLPILSTHSLDPFLQQFLVAKRESNNSSICFDKFQANFIRDFSRKGQLSQYLHEPYL